MTDGCISVYRLLEKAFFDGDLVELFSVGLTIIIDICKLAFYNYLLTPGTDLDLLSRMTGMARSKGTVLDLRQLEVSAFHLIRRR